MLPLAARDNDTGWMYRGDPLGGDEVVIVRNGKPAVRTVVVEAPPRVPTRWYAADLNISVADDFDAQLEGFRGAPAVRLLLDTHAAI